MLVNIYYAVTDAENISFTAPPPYFVSGILRGTSLVVAPYDWGNLDASSLVCRAPVVFLVNAGK